MTRVTLSRGLASSGCLKDDVGNRARVGSTPPTRWDKNKRNTLRALPPSASGEEGSRVGAPIRAGRVCAAGGSQLGGEGKLGRREEKSSGRGAEEGGAWGDELPGGGDLY